MFKKIIQYFLQGVLLVAPVVIVMYILYSLFVSVDGWLNDKISPLIGFNIPGLGIIILFISLTFLGFLGQTALIKPLKRIAGKLIKRIPLLNLLYSSINDLFSAFVGKEKKFNVPVKVLFNAENNLWKLGFVTKETMKVIDNEELAAVYFPHSYNFSGELYLVPKNRLHYLKLSPSEVMKFIVSGGVTRFENMERVELDKEL
ncbi:DUF502 domain-containing protein [Mariniphaga sp.]|uniref:DUF502 domain-containing protein n=1 Tax=Mariniphaga sp. TaxID=1954475 RepID=UPI00356173C9